MQNSGMGGTGDLGGSNTIGLGVAALAPSLDNKVKEGVAPEKKEARRSWTECVAGTVTNRITGGDPKPLRDGLKGILPKSSKGILLALSKKVGKIVPQSVLTSKKDKTSYIFGVIKGAVDSGGLATTIEMLVLLVSTSLTKSWSEEQKKWLTILGAIKEVVPENLELFVEAKEGEEEALENEDRDSERIAKLATSVQNLSSETAPKDIQKFSKQLVDLLQNKEVSEAYKRIDHNAREEELEFFKEAFRHFAHSVKPFLDENFLSGFIGTLLEGLHLRSDKLSNALIWKEDLSKHVSRFDEQFWINILGQYLSNTSVNSSISSISSFTEAIFSPKFRKDAKAYISEFSSKAGEMSLVSCRTVPPVANLVVSGLIVPKVQSVLQQSFSLVQKRMDHLSNPVYGKKRSMKIDLVAQLPEEVRQVVQNLDDQDFLQVMKELTSDDLSEQVQLHLVHRDVRSVFQKAVSELLTRIFPKTKVEGYLRNSPAARSGSVYDLGATISYAASWVIDENQFAERFLVNLFTENYLALFLPKYYSKDRDSLEPELQAKCKAVVDRVIKLGWDTGLDELEKLDISKKVGSESLDAELISPFENGFKDFLRGDQFKVMGEIRKEVSKFLESLMLRFFVHQLDAKREVEEEVHDDMMNASCVFVRSQFPHTADASIPPAPEGTPLLTYPGYEDLSRLKYPVIIAQKGREFVGVLLESIEMRYQGKKSEFDAIQAEILLNSIIEQLAKFAGYDSFNDLPLPPTPAYNVQKEVTAIKEKQIKKYAPLVEKFYPAFSALFQVHNASLENISNNKKEILKYGDSGRVIHLVESSLETAVSFVRPLVLKTLKSQLTINAKKLGIALTEDDYKAIFRVLEDKQLLDFIEAQIKTQIQAILYKQILVLYEIAGEDSKKENVHLFSSLLGEIGPVLFDKAQDLFIEHFEELCEYSKNLMSNEQDTKIRARKNAQVILTPLFDEIFKILGLNNPEEEEKKETEGDVESALIEMDFLKELLKEQLTPLFLSQFGKYAPKIAPVIPLVKMSCEDLSELKESLEKRGLPEGVDELLHKKLEAAIDCALNHKLVRDFRDKIVLEIPKKLEEKLEGITLSPEDKNQMQLLMLETFQALVDRCHKHPLIKRLLPHVDTLLIHVLGNLFHSVVDKDLTEEEQGKLISTLVHKAAPGLVKKLLSLIIEDIAGLISEEKAVEAVQASLEENKPEMKVALKEALTVNQESLAAKKKRFQDKIFQCADDFLHAAGLSEVKLDGISPNIKKGLFQGVMAGVSALKNVVPMIPPILKLQKSKMDEKLAVLKGATQKGNIDEKLHKFLEDVIPFILGQKFVKGLPEKKLKPLIQAQIEKHGLTFIDDEMLNWSIAQLPALINDFGGEEGSELRGIVLEHVEGVLIQVIGSVLTTLESGEWTDEQKGKLLSTVLNKVLPVIVKKSRDLLVDHFDEFKGKEVDELRGAIKGYVEEDFKSLLEACGLTEKIIGKELYNLLLTQMINGAALGFEAIKPHYEKFASVVNLKKGSVGVDAKLDVVRGATDQADIGTKLHDLLEKVIPFILDQKFVKGLPEKKLKPLIQAQIEKHGLSFIDDEMLNWLIGQLPALINDFGGEDASELRGIVLEHVEGVLIQVIGSVLTTLESGEWIDEQKGKLLSTVLNKALPVIVKKSRDLLVDHFDELKGMEVDELCGAIKGYVEEDFKSLLEACGLTEKIIGKELYNLLLTQMINGTALGFEALKPHYEKFASVVNLKKGSVGVDAKLEVVKGATDQADIDQKLRKFLEKVIRLVVSQEALQKLPGEKLKPIIMKLKEDHDLTFIDDEMVDWLIGQLPELIEDFGGEEGSELRGIVLEHVEGILIHIIGSVFTALESGQWSDVQKQKYQATLVKKVLPVLVKKSSELLKDKFSELKETSDDELPEAIKECVENDFIALLETSGLTKEKIGKDLYDLLLAQMISGAVKGFVAIKPHYAKIAPYLPLLEHAQGDATIRAQDGALQSMVQNNQFVQTVADTISAAAKFGMNAVSSQFFVLGEVGNKIDQCIDYHIDALYGKAIKTEEEDEIDLKDETQRALKDQIKEELKKKLGDFVKKCEKEPFSQGKLQAFFNKELKISVQEEEEDTLEFTIKEYPEAFKKDLQAFFVFKPVDQIVEAAEKLGLDLDDTTKVEFKVGAQKFLEHVRATHGEELVDPVLPQVTGISMYLLNQLLTTVPALGKRVDVEGTVTVQNPEVLWTVVSSVIQSAGQAFSTKEDQLQEVGAAKTKFAKNTTKSALNLFFQNGATDLPVDDSKQVEVWTLLNEEISKILEKQLSSQLNPVKLLKIVNKLLKNKGINKKDLVGKDAAQLQRELQGIIEGLLFDNVHSALTSPWKRFQAKLDAKLDVVVLRQIKWVLDKIFAFIFITIFLNLVLLIPKWIGKGIAKKGISNGLDLINDEKRLWHVLNTVGPTIFETLNSLDGSDPKSARYCVNKGLQEGVKFVTKGSGVTGYVTASFPVRPIVGKTAGYFAGNKVAGFGQNADETTIEFAMRKAQSTLRV